MGVAQQVWLDLSDDGRLPLAVHSSSVIEDSTSSSMAGRFVSVLHVTGWDAFVDADARVGGRREPIPGHRRTVTW